MVSLTWTSLSALITSSIINTSLAIPAPLRTVEATAAFRNNSLLVNNLSIQDPFQANSTSSANSTLSLSVSDPDYPDLAAVKCLLTWKAGTAPPSKPGRCENATTRVWFPQNTYKGVDNFQLEIAHMVLDPTVGQCPQYCALDKFATLNLTYPGTQGFDCNPDASCKQSVNSTFNAIIFSAVA